MAIVRSKYSLQDIIGFALIILLIGILAFISTIVPLWENSKKIQLLNIVLILSVLAFLVFATYKLLKATPLFYIDKDCIYIKGTLIRKRKITRSDISEIDLFAVGGVIGRVTIVTKVTLSNGEKLRIADPNYRNIGELKLALIECFPEKIKSFKTQKKESLPNLLTDNETLKFSGNSLINFNTLFFLGSTISLIAISFSPNRVRTLNDMIIVVLFVSITLFIGIGLQMHFFIFNDEYVIVKNHYFPWYKKYYRVENILAMNFESNRRHSKSLRITTKDFKSRYYSAGSLRDKTWEELKEYIKSRGIYFID